MPDETHAYATPPPDKNTGTLELFSRFDAEPSILDHFVRDLDRSGCAGQERPAKLLYLALTSRLFDDRPISVFIKGERGGGKNSLVEGVADECASRLRQSHLRGKVASS